MPRRYPADMLRALRNDIPIDRLIAEVLDWPSKHSEGHFRFLCPLCSEFNSATNPNTNLGRCFRCQKNFNPIDMVMVVNQCPFVEAVQFLRRLSNLGKSPRREPHPHATSQSQIKRENQDQIM